MMSKKVKVLVAGLVAVVLLTMGGATVMAQEGPAPSPEASAEEVSPDDLLARVAEILGISQGELINAFTEAKQGMTAEAFSEALDKAVEEGIITQEEADEIEEWWGQKPEVLKPKLFRRAFAFRVMRGRRMGAFRGWGCPELPKPSEPVE